MDKLLQQSYTFELVDENPLSIKYEFVCSCEKEVPKRVSIKSYDNLEGYFNLGFGNITISDDGVESIEDMSRDNNKTDGDKVLITVFSCALDYLSNNTNCKLTFYGNTAVKHRLYKMKISNKIDLLSIYFIVKGGFIKDLIVEETPDGKDVKDSINIDNIFLEFFNIKNSVHYHFIVFELKDEYKDE